MNILSFSYCVKKIILVVVLFLIVPFHVHAYKKVIYNDDGRSDEGDVSDLWRDLGRAAFMLVSKNRMTRDGEYYTFNAEDQLSYFQVDSLGCNGSAWPFPNQGLLGQCSGALVESNGVQFMITAGHCVQEFDSEFWDACTGMYYVLQANNTAVASGRFHESVVYECETPVVGEMEYKAGFWVDYGVIKLDRDVPSYIATPVPIRRDHQVEQGEDVLLVGHPYGLPKKYDASYVNYIDIDGSSSFAYNFYAPFDAFGGNSGSGVYSLSTYELVGILVAGNSDFYDSTDSLGNSCVGVVSCYNKSSESDLPVEFECVEEPVILEYGEEMTGSTFLFSSCSDSSVPSYVTNVVEWQVFCGANQEETTEDDDGDDDDTSMTTTTTATGGDDDDTMTTTTEGTENDSSSPDDPVYESTAFIMITVGLLGMLLIGVLAFLLFSCFKMKK